MTVSQREDAATSQQGFSLLEDGPAALGLVWNQVTCVMGTVAPSAPAEICRNPAISKKSEETRADGSTEIGFNALKVSLSG